jgi:hypothetical protein
LLASELRSSLLAALRRSAPRTGFLFSVAILPDDLAFFLLLLVDGGFFPSLVLGNAAALWPDPELWPRRRHDAAFSQNPPLKITGIEHDRFLQFIILSLNIFNFALHLLKILKY